MFSTSPVYFFFHFFYPDIYSKHTHTHTNMVILFLWRGKKCEYTFHSWALFAERIKNNNNPSKQTNISIALDSIHICCFACMCVWLVGCFFFTSNSTDWQSECAIQVYCSHIIFFASAFVHPLTLFSTHSTRGKTDFHSNYKFYCSEWFIFPLV